jgi:site-specific DNA-methyltransferase (adenine-specific)
VNPYYSDESVTLYHGDCLEILPQIPHTPRSIVLTDPPYGIGVRYGSGSDDARDDYWQWHAEWLAEARRISPVVVFTHKVSALQQVTGWDHIGAWTKPQSFGVRLGNSPVVPHWEPIFMFGIHSIGTNSEMTPDVFAARPVPQTAGGKRGRESWEKQQATKHPVPKPEGLYARLLDAFGQRADTVIEPFAGSGTTLRVAKDAGMKAIGVEIEERFCELIATRMSQEVLDFGGAA